jgi:hypothetical protein
MKFLKEKLKDQFESEASSDRKQLGFTIAGTYS